MTDKVQKIREEVEKRYKYWKEKESNSHSIESEIRMSECQHLLLMFDSMQEEPKAKFKVGDRIREPFQELEYTITGITDYCYLIGGNGCVLFKEQDQWELVEEPKQCMYSKDNYTEEDRKVLCEGCEEKCEFNQVKESAILQHKEETCKENGDSLTQETVSDELEKAAVEAFKLIVDSNRNNFLEIFKAGANWQKKRDYIPLSDDINEVARQICNKVLNCEIDYKEDDVVLSDEEECVKAGIRWQMQKESIPSKDLLEELINNLSKRYPEISFAKLSRIAVRVAKWQQEKEYTCYEEAFEDGAKWKVENLWKPANGDDLPEIDREVIALLDNGKVGFAHRPPEYWDGKNIITGKVTRYYPKTYGKGGWNIPNVKYWLDARLPYEEK